ncbi:MAG: AAA family ATPase [Phycisphaeraceae bacterium]|nr:AAA family ATPase [Phycisphaeraceae bacterium]
MRIEQITFKNYRCFGTGEAPTVFEFAAGINVFLGENASGKTALLDGVVAALGAFFEKLPVQPGSHPAGSIRRDDATGTLPVDAPGVIGRDDATQVLDATPGLARQSWRYPVDIHCTATVDDSLVDWRRTLAERSGRTTSGANTLSEAIGRTTTAGDAILPLIAYYGHGRLWHVRRNQPIKDIDEAQDRLAGYARCLEPSTDRAHLLAWWQRVELAAGQRPATQGPLPEKVILDAALLRVLPGAVRVWFDGVVGQPVVAFPERTTRFDQLSAGYKNMLGIILDLVSRVTRLNAHLGVDAARRTPGVVLIDEIDQHLHPRWQRQVLSDLRELFPAVQFIVTTHAPQVLVGARAGEVRVLRRDEDGQIRAEPVDVPPGLRADEVLTGEWFGLASTLDVSTLGQIEAHRQMLRDGTPTNDPTRLALEAELRRRLGRFHDTSIEGMALSVLAELTADRPARSAEERSTLKAALRAKLAASVP